MNPEDFDQLGSRDQDLADLTLDRIPMSDLVLEAHRFEDAPGVLIEDLAAISAYLGL